MDHPTRHGDMLQKDQHYMDAGWFTEAAIKQRIE
jgi:hypothetical protein